MPSADALEGKLLDIYESMDEQERETYLEALNTYSLSAERLAWSLDQMGYDVSPSLIRTFRRARRFHARVQ